MYVVELFLPLARGDGSPVAPGEIEGIVAGMADRFGGATAFTRAPAEGLWKAAEELERDRIVIIEVMVDKIDNTWWSGYRARLEAEFQQQEILIRSHNCDQL